MHRGDLSVTSSPGSGSTFTVTLPLIAPDTADDGSRHRRAVDQQYDLTRFDGALAVECAANLHRLFTGAADREIAAQRAVEHLHQGLVDERGQPACVLVRLFATQPYAGLDTDRRNLARARLGGSAPDPSSPCLVLLGTAGERPEWCSVLTSVSHRVIPLPNPDALAAAPMLAQLFAQLGAGVRAGSGVDPALLIDVATRSHNVFHVEEALGSPHVPDQATFVRPLGIRSVVGAGGILPSGDLCALVLFSHSPIDRETARRFRTVAVALTGGLTRLDSVRGT